MISSGAVWWVLPMFLYEWLFGLHCTILLQEVCAKFLDMLCTTSSGKLNGVFKELLDAWVCVHVIYR